MAAPTFLHSSTFSGDSAGNDDEPGNVIPKASIALAIVFAVYIYAAVSAETQSQHEHVHHHMHLVRGMHFEPWRNGTFRLRESYRPG